MYEKKPESGIKEVRILEGIKSLLSPDSFWQLIN